MDTNAKTRVKKWASFVLRWGIAVVGIWYVVDKITLHDTVYLLDLTQKNPLVAARLAEPVHPDFDKATIYDPKTGQPRRVERGDLFTEADLKTVQVVTTAGSARDFPGDVRGYQGSGPHDDTDNHQRIVTVNGRRLAYPYTPEPAKRKLLAVQLRGDLKTAQLFVTEDPSGKREIVGWYEPEHARDPLTAKGVNDYKLRVPRLPVQVGLLPMLKHSRPFYICLALLIFPLTFIITSYRWHELLKALEIHIGTARAFVLNMVGAFYNTFLPGSTGGDVLKAYYISKHTPHRTRGVMSVFVDRIIGLLALVVLGGAMAGYQYFKIGNGDDAVGRLCAKIALVSGAICAGVAGGLFVFYHPLLRRFIGLDWLIKHMPLQHTVQNAVTVMEIYRRRPMLVLWSLVVTLPVHATVAVSAIFAGKALQLPLSSMYYFVCVPVIVLAGSIPISPQGAGVMEFFAIKLTEKQHASVSEAVALAMAIRLTQIFWNLTGGLLVIRGGYHAPTKAEKEETEKEDEAAVKGIADC